MYYTIVVNTAEAAGQATPAASLEGVDNCWIVRIASHSPLKHGITSFQPAW